MPATRGHRPAQAGPSDLQVEFAAELGQLLAAARAERRLSVEDVSLALLLSTRQVRALESADPSAFHSPAFFIRGMKKYVEFVGVAGVPDDLFARLMQQTPAGDAGPPRKARRPGRQVPRVALFTGVVIVLVIAAVAMAVFTARRAPGAVPPASEAASGTSSQPAEPLASVPLLPVSAFRAPLIEDSAGVSEEAADSGVGSITLPVATWLFVRYGNNEVVERRLAARTPFRFAGVPVFLAAGAAEGVRLELRGRAVDVSAYTVNGQVRIGRAELAALMAR